MGAMLNVMDYGALADNKADDTGPIPRALAALPEARGVLFVPPGHYLMDTVHRVVCTGQSGLSYAHRSRRSRVGPVRRRMSRRPLRRYASGACQRVRPVIVGSNPSCQQAEFHEGPDCPKDGHKEDQDHEPRLAAVMPSLHLYRNERPRQGRAPNEAEKGKSKRVRLKRPAKDGEHQVAAPFDSEPAQHPQPEP